MLEVGGKQYRTQVASDVDRDGMWLEVEDEGNALVATVFYSDRDGSMTFTAHQPGMPLEVIEWLISQAKTRLVPSAREGS